MQVRATVYDVEFMQGDFMRVYVILKTRQCFAGSPKVITTHLAYRKLEFVCVQYQLRVRAARKVLDAFFMTKSIEDRRKGLVVQGWSIVQQETEWFSSMFRLIAFRRARGRFGLRLVEETVFRIFSGRRKRQ